MSLSVPNRIFLFALWGLPVNALFSRPSLVEGYIVTPCTECDSPTATRDGERVPERCDRPSCCKFDRFPLVCLLVALRQGGFKTIDRKGKLSLVLHETPTLRKILVADGGLTFWIPRRIADRKRLDVERVIRSRGHITLRAPVWRGEERPFGARRVRPRSNFPNSFYLTRLVKDHAYPPDSAIAATCRAHNPWTRPVPDRSQRSAANADEQSSGGGETSGISSPNHPYRPESPSRRTKTGGGLTREQVERALVRKRWDGRMKLAVFEIVYRRQSTLRMADAFGLPAESLSVYASRLRADLRAA